MRQEKADPGAVWRFLFSAFCLTAIAPLVIGMVFAKSEETELILSGDGKSLSVDAENPSPANMLTHLTRAIDIPIQALVHESESVTDRLRDRPPERSMRRSSDPVGASRDPESGALERLVLLPEGAEQPFAGGNPAEGDGAARVEFEIVP